MSLTVAIPSLNNTRQLADTLISLVRNTDFAGRIIVVNNGEPGSYEAVQGVVPYDLDWIDMGTNAGWMGGINQALKHATTDLFCMLNDDVLFPPCSTTFWDKLLRWFDLPEAGGVGPTSNFVSGYQNAFHHCGWPVLRVPYLIGFCAVYRTETLLELGGLDESLPGGDDLDLSIRIIDTKRYLIADRRVYLHHHGQQTGRRVHPGEWDSQKHQADTYNALIRKHGLRRWYDCINGAADDAPSVWLKDNPLRQTQLALKTSQTTLEGMFAKARTVPSDINTHLELLYRLASTCKSVVETGTADGTSTTALLAAQPESLDCFDIEKRPEVDTLAAVAGRTRFTFHEQDVLKADGSFPEADMWFLDDYHTYDHVKAELALHAHKIKRFIAAHDVTMFHDYGEDGSKPGIWAAIAEFAREHPEWKLTHHTEQNNGLAVLTRGA